MTTTTPGKPSRSVARPTVPRPAAGGQPIKSRRRTWQIALGTAILLVGALFTWFLTTITSRTVQVLTTSAAIDRGEVITENDLNTISIAGGQTIDVTPARDAADIVGQIAAVDLPAGSLLTSANVINTLPVPDGQSIVGIALSPNQLPSYRLQAGDRVRLVDTPVAQGEPPADDPITFDATVFTTRLDEQNQVWVVDIIVPEDEAASIAARAATQRVSIVLDGAGE